MKKSSQLPLFLALALAAPISASAASLADTYKEIIELRRSAEKDLAYVAMNGPNCTNHTDYLNQAVAKAKEKLDAVDSDLKKGFSKLLSLPTEETCKAPDSKNLKPAIRGMASARDNIEFLTTQFRERPSMMSSRNGHDLMLAMLAAADGYPRCIPTKRNKDGSWNMNSTPESLAYQSFYRRVIKLGDMLKQLEEDGGLKKIVAKQCDQASTAPVRFAAYHSAGGGAFERAVDDAVNYSDENNSEGSAL